MATRQGTLVKTDDGYAVATWDDIQENGGVFDVGTPVRMGEVQGLCAQGIGNFDTSFTVIMQGSNDGVNYATLHTPEGGPAILTAALTWVEIRERPLFIRPQGADAGAADASDVLVIMVGSQHR